MSAEVKKLLQNGEFKSLLGEKSIRLILLSIILTLTLLAICFSNGGLDYLDKKMNDPYTNWVNLRIPRYISDAQYSELKRTVSSKSSMSEYNLSGIAEYVTFKEVFNGKQDISGENRLKGRTVDSDNPIYSRIVSEQNLVYSQFDTIPTQECGLIIKESSLINLGYSQPNSQDYVELIIDSSLILFDVWAVVKNLPDNCDFVTSPGVHNLLFESNSETDFITKPGSVNKLSILAENKEISEKIFSKIFESYKIKNIAREQFNLNAKDFRLIYTIKFNSYIDSDYLKSIKPKLQELGLEVYHKYNCNIPFTSLRDAYYLSFNFEKLDMIRPFKNKLSNSFDIELEMSQVESKENFAFVSRLSLFISTMLLIFGVLSIIFFINNTLMMYLRENSENLGTLKAFGLDNKTLSSIYFSGMIKMFSYALLIAISICLIVELIEGLLNDGISVFKFFDLKTYLSILILGIATYLVVNKVLKNILNCPPGDLIYGRN